MMPKFAAFFLLLTWATLPKRLQARTCKGKDEALRLLEIRVRHFAFRVPVFSVWNVASNEGA